MGCSLCKSKTQDIFRLEREKIDKILEMQLRMDRYEESLKYNINTFSIVLEYLDLSGGHSVETEELFEKRIRMRRRDGPVYGMKIAYDQECDKEERMRGIVKELEMFCRENK